MNILDNYLEKCAIPLRKDLVSRFVPNAKNNVTSDNKGVLKPDPLEKYKNDLLNSTNLRLPRTPKVAQYEVKITPIPEEVPSPPRLSIPTPSKSQETSSVQKVPPPPRLSIPTPSKSQGTSSVQKVPPPPRLSIPTPTAPESRPNPSTPTPPPTSAAPKPKVISPAPQDVVKYYTLLKFRNELVSMYRNDRAAYENIKARWGKDEADAFLKERQEKRKQRMYDYATNLAHQFGVENPFDQKNIMQQIQEFASKGPHKAIEQQELKPHLYVQKPEQRAALAGVFDELYGFNGQRYLALMDKISTNGVLDRQYAITWRIHRILRLLDPINTDKLRFGKDPGARIRLIQNSRQLRNEALRLRNVFDMLEKSFYHEN